jgi:hypothetical protein
MWPLKCVISSSAIPKTKKLLQKELYKRKSRRQIKDKVQKQNYLMCFCKK